MPSKQRSQSPAARGRSPSPAPGPALLKARHACYKDGGGSTAWLPDHEKACELAAVTFLLLPGFLGSYVFLQRLCVIVTGGCVLARFLFAMELPKSTAVQRDKNDRLIAQAHASAAQLETALELAMPEVSGDKGNASYFDKGKPAKGGVKGLWYQPADGSPPQFVGCADLLAEDTAELYTVPVEEAKKASTELFATNPAVQKGALEKKIKKDWSNAEAGVEAAVVSAYGVGAVAVLITVSGFQTYVTFFSLLLTALLACGAHMLGLGMNTAPVEIDISFATQRLGLGQLVGDAINIPTPIWRQDLELRRTGQPGCITGLKGLGGNLRSVALALAAGAGLVRPLFVVHQLRKLAEWLPKDLVVIACEVVVEVLQHLFRLLYRFVLYPALMRESSYTLALKERGHELLRLCVELSGTKLEFWTENPEACKAIYMKRENDDLQKAEKLMLFLGVYSLVMVGLQKVSPKVLEGRGFFYGLINIAVVVVLCAMFVRARSPPPSDWQLGTFLCRCLSLALVSL